MDQDTWKVVKIGIGAVVVILFLSILSGFFSQIDTSERGVLLTFGAFNGTVYDQGLHFKLPLVQDVVKINVQVQKIAIGQSEAYSRDLQVVDIQSVLNYSIDPGAAGDVYRKYGVAFESKVITPRIDPVIKQTIAKYSAEELLAKREVVQAEINDAIKASIPTEFINVKYSLINEVFSKDYEAAIESKQVAQQKAEQAKYELQQAQTDAQSRIAKAQGEAEAIKVQASAIQSQGGADYVKLQWIAKWNGVLPATSLGASTPIVDFSK